MGVGASRRLGDLLKNATGGQTPMRWRCRCGLTFRSASAAWCGAKALSLVSGIMAPAQPVKSMDLLAFALQVLCRIMYESLDIGPRLVHGRKIVTQVETLLRHTPLSHTLACQAVACAVMVLTMHTSPHASAYSSCTWRTRWRLA